MLEMRSARWFGDLSPLLLAFAGPGRHAESHGFGPDPFDEPRNFRLLAQLSHGVEFLFELFLGEEGVQLIVTRPAEPNGALHVR